MLAWLHSLLPHTAHYGCAFVFAAVFLNNIGVPLPGKTVLLGAGFIVGNAAGSLWQPIAAGTLACFLGGICAFGMGRRLGDGGLETVHWLHLNPRRARRHELFFKHHGAKAVLVARLIPLLPPIAVNLLAGMARMPWRIFLFFGLTGSAVWAVSYFLIGYSLGRKWMLPEPWLGPTTLYLISAGTAFITLSFILRHVLHGPLAHLLSRNKRRKPA